MKLFYRCLLDYVEKTLVVGHRFGCCDFLFTPSFLLCTNRWKAHENCIPKYEIVFGLKISSVMV